MYNPIVSIIFRIINLAVLLAVGFYFFKKYLLSSVEDAISDQEAYKNGLAQQKNAFHNRIYETEIEAEALQQHCSLLKHKVGQWRTFYQQMDEKNNREKEVILTKLDAARQIQQEHYRNQQMLKATLPKALSDANQALTREYGHEKQQKMFLDSLISSLKDLS